MKGRKANERINSTEKKTSFFFLLKSNKMSV